VSRDRCLAFVRDLEAHDLSRLDQWFSDKSVVRIPPCDEIQGARRILAFFRSVFRLYDEIHWHVTDVYETGERHCAYLTESWGTLRGGVPYHNQIVTLVEFDDQGCIIFLSDYFKDTSAFVRTEFKAS
jgi:ketosteroid isomerase-like protein